MTRRYWNINLEEMMEAGVHFGHGTRKWNPRMGPYISAKRKGIHITNLTRTARFLSEACDLVFDAASRGKLFLIVGTKNKAADSVARAAIKARCHYVNKKWLGGMLTNWSTTETRLHKFRDLRTEQKTGERSSGDDGDVSLDRRMYGKGEGDGELLSPVLYREKLVETFDSRGFVNFKNLAKMSRPDKKKTKNRSDGGEEVGAKGEKRKGKNEFSVLEVVEDDLEGESLSGLLGEEFKGRKWRGSTRLLLLDEQHASKGAEELPEAIKVYVPTI